MKAEGMTEKKQQVILRLKDVMKAYRSFWRMNPQAIWIQALLISFSTCLKR